MTERGVRMKTLNEWLTAYGRDHKNPLNQKIHKVCVPLIMWSLLGLLWAIPVPGVFISIPYLNWSTLFCLGCLVFYFLIAPKVFFLMAVVSGVLLATVAVVAATGWLWQISLIIFVVAWMGQFYGHKVEGQKPSFLEDLQFLLIGPIWVFKGFLIQKSL